MTPQQFQAAIAELEAGADVLLPVAGHAELLPIAQALGALAVRIDAAVQAKRPADTLAAEAQAIRTAADVAADAKFGPEPTK